MSASRKTLFLLISFLVASSSGILVRNAMRSLTFWNWQAPSASPTETMMAAFYEKHGDPEVLQYGTKHRPIPNENQLLIKVAASSVNPVDFKSRRNAVPDWVLPKPKIPGADLAGTIVEIGSKVEEGWKIDDRVVAMMPIFGSEWGSHAEYVAIDASLVARLPESIDLESAASLPLVSLTVLQSFQHLRDRTGKTILIHAGAGGVGSIAIQYAKHVLGMYVVTTASSEKEAFLRELGADLVIDYRKTDFTTIAKDYDVVLDPMSFLYEAKTFDSNVLKDDGHYLNIMSSDWSLGSDGKERSMGSITVWNFLKFKVFGRLLPWIIKKRYDICAVSPNGKDLQTIIDLVRDGTIRPVIDRVFPLSDVSAAHRYLEGGHATGKVVIRH